MLHPLEQQYIDHLALGNENEPGMLLLPEHHVIHTTVKNVLENKHEDLNDMSLVYWIWLDKPNNDFLYIGTTDKNVKVRLTTHYAKNDGVLQEDGRRIKLESVGEFNDTGSWKDWRSIKHKWPNFDYYNADVTLFKVRNAETNAIHLYKPKANKEYSKDYL